MDWWLFHSLSLSRFLSTVSHCKFFTYVVFTFDGRSPEMYVAFMCCRLCPIFQVSNVSGENLDLLKMFLNLLTARMISRDDEPAEFQIDDTYSVPVSDIQV
jgi:GTPase